MAKQDQSTMTDRNSRFYSWRVRDILSLISSLVLPMMLGIFTVVITLHQQKMTLQQRQEDRALAREQREQDLNISREQRQQDLHLFAIQREQDLNISREQRLHDMKIAEDRRQQENLIAEKQRNLSDLQRKHELDITENQIQSSLVVSFIKEMSELLLAHQGKLTHDPLLATITRAKVMTILQLIDSAQKGPLIEFLHEAKLLVNGHRPLDLSGANLDNVNFTLHMNNKRTLSNLYLAGAFLRNSSFSQRQLMNANFSGAELTDARFDKANLINVDFSDAFMIRTNLSAAILNGARFDRALVRRAPFRHASAVGASFIGTELDGSNFHLVDFRNAHFFRVNSAGIDWARALFHNATFDDVEIRRGNFSSAQFIETKVLRSRLLIGNFSAMKMSGLVIRNSSLQDGRFTQVTLRDVDLTEVDMSEAIFDDVDLSFATFSFAKLHRAQFRNVTTYMTNFSFAVMTQAKITDAQLVNASSLRGTHLPNGTIIERDLNLLVDSEATCNQTLPSSAWEIFPTNSIIIRGKDSSRKHCIFANQNNTPSNLSQQIDASNFKALLSRRRQVYAVTLRGAGGNISSIVMYDHCNRSMATFPYQSGVEPFKVEAYIYTFQPRVSIEFSGYGWFRSIELTVQGYPQAIEHPSETTNSCKKKN